MLLENDVSSSVYVRQMLQCPSIKPILSRKIKLFHRLIIPEYGISGVVTEVFFNPQCQIFNFFLHRTQNEPNREGGG